MLLKGSRKYWLIAILCGLLAALLSYQYLNYVQNRYRPDDLIQVVKARTDIPRDSLISAEQVEVVEVPAKYSHPGAAGNKQDVVGRIALADISAGEEILGKKVLSLREKGDRLAYSVPLNKRAVSIPINEVSSVAGYIKAGDRVDVIATLDIPDGGQETTYTVLTLQDIEVLAVGSNSSSGQEEVGKTLTLAVTLSEAQPLVLASERGSIRLLLRSPVDQSRNELQPMKMRDFLPF